MKHEPSAVDPIASPAGAGQQWVDMAGSITERWLRATIDYIPTWIELQLRAAAQPGCVVAIALEGPAFA
jgi:hypothetical protein